MKPILIAERSCLVTHIAAMAFGLAGLLLVLPHPEFILSLPAWGQQLFQWSMSGGGVVYIVLGAITVALYAYRVLGLGKLLGFMLPAIAISLSSELLGTSTGFPFGNYAYLNGLGYKIAGLVPFTIPLSWFYMGLACFLLAGSLTARLPRVKGMSFLLGFATILLGSVLLTAWDFVLDPAMSQAPVPFWEFQQVGAFFGMPYRNLLGWTGTGAIFMTVASLCWRQAAFGLQRSHLGLPLLIYLVNFGFGAAITLVTLDQRFWIPSALGLLLGVIPAILCWWTAPKQDSASNPAASETSVPPLSPVSLEALTK